MNTYQYYFGWDISQLTLNWCLYDRSAKIVAEGQIANRRPAIRSFLNSILTKYGISATEVFCLIEQTGLYSNRLAYEAHILGLITCVEDALKINKDNRRQLDKSDLMDARIIGRYGLEKAYRLTQWKPDSTPLQRIKGLHRRRRNLMKAKQSIATSYQYSLDWDEIVLDADIGERIEEHVLRINQTIDLIDERITQIILAEEELAEIYHRVRSVVGFGPKNTIVFLLETMFLQKVKTAKACANYAGLRPNEKSSGTSLNKRKRTPKQVNVALKTAFHIAAFAAIRTEHLKAYYVRKRAENKTHLQVINAVRNKLCRALYACHENQVMYERNLQATLVIS
jgi:transposase